MWDVVSNKAFICVVTQCSFPLERALRDDKNNICVEDYVE